MSYAEAAAKGRADGEAGRSQRDWTVEEFEAASEWAAVEHWAYQHELGKYAPAAAPAPWPLPLAGPILGLWAVESRPGWWRTPRGLLLSAMTLGLGTWVESRVRHLEQERARRLGVARRMDGPRSGMDPLTMGFLLLRFVPFRPRAKASISVQLATAARTDLARRWHWRPWTRGRARRLRP